jgi:hypothetical protein
LVDEKQIDCKDVVEKIEKLRVYRVKETEVKKRINEALSNDCTIEIWCVSTAMIDRLSRQLM